jgi:hypothetical protein
VTSTLRGVRSPVRSARYGRAANDVGRPWRARGRSELTRQMSLVRTQSHPPAPGHIFGCAHTIRPRRLIQGSHTPLHRGRVALPSSETNDSSAIRLMWHGGAGSF